MRMVAVLERRCSMGPPPSSDILASFDSRKNRVLVYRDRVSKTFKVAWSSALHARREVKALRLLAGLEGVPAVLMASADRRTIVVSRVPGRPLSECETVAEHTMVRLRELVERMLERGVARHSLPARDVLVDVDGSVGLVDFERSSRRLFPGDPVWLVAKLVSRFHLLRLVDEHAPQLLTQNERRRLRWLLALRASLQPVARLLRKARRALTRTR